ncbi:GntR family transcriptional regulator [Streptomyces sp. NPDC001297]|uniref:GntR family transcriptional regulator n=1 Tax=Streptomyces sp. NPDC001297 TaxID=3364559 RepID=UPI0036D154A5
MTPPDIDRTPPYMQVVKQLRQQILDGDLKDGDKIPSVREISERWGISMATGHKVLATLRADGLVESIVGSGTIVRTKSNVHRSARDRFTRMLATGRIYAPGEYAVISAAELAPAPAHIADTLGIDEGDMAIRRHRVTNNEDGPVSASTSWFHASLAESVPALLSTERIPGGTPSAIKDATGRVARSAEDRMTVSTASTEQASDLGIQEGSPVLIGRNVLRDEAGEVIEAGEYVSGPDRWTLYQYELGESD